jgi:hypothetical protein
MKLAGVVAFGLAVLAHTNADAECGTPQWLGTPNGASIPTKGSLFFYSEENGVDAKKVGGPITAVTKLSDTVVRLDYSTKADELEITAQEPAVYQVSSYWKPPAAAPRVIQTWHHQYEWTCSTADSVMLQIDQPTAAFRVFWRYKDHPTREWIVPARTGDGNVNVLELGKINCGSTTIDPNELAAGGSLTLIAIRYDGSEVAVAGLPPTLSTADMPTSKDGIERAIAYPAGTEPTAPVPYQDHDWPFYLFMLLLVPAGALTYVALRDRGLKSAV